MSALSIIKEAAECGVRVSLNGDSVALKAATKPSADLLALKSTKPGLSHCYGKQPVPSVRRDIPMLNG